MFGQGGRQLLEVGEVGSPSLDGADVLAPGKRRFFPCSSMGIARAEHAWNPGGVCSSRCVREFPDRVDHVGGGCHRGNRVELLWLASKG